MGRLRWLPSTLATCLALALLPAAAAALDLQGHRGARGLAPENTLAGVATALGIGVTTLELDLGVTRDGTVVVVHDQRLSPDLARTADGGWVEPPGPAIAELTVAELKSFDVGRIRPGSDYAARFPEQRPVDGATVPTLAEVVALVRKAGNRTVRFNLETKLSPLAPELAPDPEVFAGAVVEAIESAGIAGRTTIQSFDWRTLHAVQALTPQIALACLTAEQLWFDTVGRGRAGASPWTAGLDVDQFAGDVAVLAAAAGCDVWSPHADDVDRAAVHSAHRRGLRVIVWTVNDPAEMERLIELRVDGIITDYPDRLRRVMAARDLALPAPTPVEP
jgi:glycerophosphoryl diester phosphodiesterase